MYDTLRNPVPISYMTDFMMFKQILFEFAAPACTGSGYYFHKKMTQ